MIFSWTLTSTSSDEEIEELYSDLDRAYKQSRGQDLIVGMGDLNNNVEQEQDPLKEMLRRHGLGRRHERGDIWVDLCVTQVNIYT